MLAMLSPMSPIIMSIGAVGIVSLISLVGATTLSFKPAFLQRIIFLLIALAAGALLGDAFIHLIPEAFEQASTFSVAISILVGILAFFILEKFLHWHHRHGDEEFAPDHARIHPVGQLVLVSDCVHNLIDGLAIGAAFLVSPEIGVATTIAIALHEIPQEIGDFALLIHAGFSRTRALFLNFFSALSAFVGLGIAFWLSESIENAVPLVAAFAAGNFIYLALADIVPELHKTTGIRNTLFQFAMVLVGLVAMALLLSLE